MISITFRFVNTGRRHGCGVVFKWTNSAGTWTQSVIHAFTAPRDAFNLWGRAADCLEPCDACMCMYI